MGFLDLIEGLVRGIGEGFTDMITDSSKICCAACEKCSSTKLEGTYKRVFLCSNEWYNFNIGSPILGSKVEHITPPYYPPCKGNYFQSLCPPESPYDYTKRGPLYGEYLDLDTKYDWEIGRDNQSDSTNEGNNNW